MAIKDKYRIERRYITNRNARSRMRLNQVRFVVSHETANNGADADDHYHFFNRINNQTSAHTFIDYRKILEIIPLNEKAWHVQYNKPTDNRMFGADANDAAIGVELCRPGDFAKAYDRYVWYHAYLCKKFGLQPKRHIVSHRTLDPQRRRDPESWLNPNGVTWNEFINDVQAYYEAWEEDEVTAIAPDTQVASANSPNYLQRGDSGPEVRELQKKLRDLGYSIGSYGVDGVCGADTEKAVREFQRDYGLVVDGVYGENSKRVLSTAKRTTKSSSSRSYLKRGDSGSKVREMQNKLRDLGYSLGSYGADGVFGADTERALIQFQREHGLQVDGIYGEESKRVLSNAKPNNRFNLPSDTYWVKTPRFSGAGVRRVQEALASLYFYPDKNAKNYGIDGFYGPQTADAVRRFQLIHMGEDEADGEYGPKTKNVMERVLASN